MDTDSIASMCGTIIKEAETESAQIIAQAEKQAEQKVRLAEQEVQSRIKKIVSQAEEESTAAVKKIQASFEVEKHKMTMLKQEELIKQVVEQLEKNITEFAASESYTEFLKRAVSDTVHAIGEKKVCVRIGKTDPAKEVQALIAGIEKKDGISCVLEEKRHAMHGIEAYNADKSIRIINTLEELMRARKEDIRPLIYKQLFGKGA
ncbi:hypothetical protein KDK77_03960 [bacterium]|nr:hypothetical protein [bacterium]